MKSIIVSTLLLALMLPGFVSAQSPGGSPPNPSPGGNPGTTLINPLKGGGNLQTFLNNILGVVIQIGAVVVILMLVYVGFLFVTARGDTGKLSTARQALLWTVVGALILLGAKAISAGIQATVQALGG